MLRTLFAIVLVSLVGCGGETGHPFAQQPVVAATVQRACAMIASCWPTSIAPTVSGCVEQYEMALLYGPADATFFPEDQLTPREKARFIDCAAQAASCDATLRCLGKLDTSWCDAHPDPACDGDTLVGCWDGAPLVQHDCGAVGMRCVKGADGVAVCGDGNSCNAAVTPCHGGAYEQCSDGVVQRYDCNAFEPGSTCLEVKGADGTAITGCAANGQPGCTVADYAGTCDGNDMTFCNSGVSLHVACSEVGRHCGAASSGTVGCLPNGSDCDGSTDACTSSGDAMQICVDGAWVTTSCSTLGFTTCSLAATTSATALQARCR